MSSSGTLLSDLESNGGGGDNNDDQHVKNILMEMNNGGGQGNMIMSPNPNSTSQMSMDSRPALSHVIGNEQPTAGDFAAAMHGLSRQNMQQQPQQQLPSQQPWLSGGSGGAPYTNQQYQEPMVDSAPKKNMYSQIADELKTPVLVTLLVFIFSLPFINVLFQHYIPSLVKTSGDMTGIGLLLKAVLAGGTFWVLQRVVAPLISL